MTKLVLHIPLLYALRCKWPPRNLAHLLLDLSMVEAIHGEDEVAAHSVSQLVKLMQCALGWEVGRRAPDERGDMERGQVPRS